MLRYHRQVYFSQEDIIRLRDFTDKINPLIWQYTKHCIDNLKYRAINIEGVLRFIKGIILKPDLIFEFYADDISQVIIKACYRVRYNDDIDLILVIGKDKQIITIYYNSAGDSHITLKKELYQKGIK